jgi:hypothetical protein
VDNLPKEAQEIFRNAVSNKRTRVVVPVGEDMGDDKTAKQKRARDGYSADKESDKQFKDI